MSFIGNSKVRKGSLLRFMKLHMRYESERDGKACVKYLQAWYPLFCPDRMNILSDSQSTASELGSHLATPSLPTKYSWIRSMFGWEAANPVRWPLSPARASFSRHWEKAMFGPEALEISRQTLGVFQ